MATLEITIVSAILIAVIVFLSGRWMNRSGKPYNTIVLALHKLISFGIFVYIIISCYQLNGAVAFTSAESACCLSAAGAFLAAVASGGFLSTNRPMPSFVQVIHRVSSTASTLLTGILIYILRGRI
jgi:hypothetical protein